MTLFYYAYALATAGLVFGFLADTFIGADIKRNWWGVTWRTTLAVLGIIILWPFVVGREYIRSKMS